MTDGKCQQEIKTRINKDNQVFTMFYLLGDPLVSAFKVRSESSKVVSLMSPANRLVGLMVMASASRVEDPVFESRVESYK